MIEVVKYIGGDGKERVEGRIPPYHERGCLKSVSDTARKLKIGCTTPYKFPPVGNRTRQQNGTIYPHWKAKEPLEGNFLGRGRLRRPLGYH